MAYVPPRDKCPLLLENDEGGPVSAFDVPGWGSVVVWNPPTCTGGDDETKTSGNAYEYSVEADA